jgi:hypothetical protein
VTWVSIHTWDPLQRGLDDPVLAAPDRHSGFRDLGALVRNAHAAGLRVMVKPHLEAGWDRALAPLEPASRRFGRPVLLTEAGFPSVATAAKAPWQERRAPADVWLQARCYEADTLARWYAGGQVLK